MSITTPLQTSPLGALGAAPCSSEGIIESLLRLISPPEFDKATDVVARSVCTNYYRSYLQPDCFFSVEPSSEIVCGIVVAYMNAAAQGLIPDYEPGMNPTTGTGSPYWFSWNGALAIEEVARITTRSRKLVAEILYELYYATADGRVTSSAYARPRAYAENAGILTSVPKGSDVDKHRSFLDFGLDDMVRWGIICAVVTAGTFAVLQLINLGRAFTRRG